MLNTLNLNRFNACQIWKCFTLQINDTFLNFKYINYITIFLEFKSKQNIGLKFIHFKVFKYIEKKNQ